jgi:hypothetical protein
MISIKTVDKCNEIKNKEHKKIVQIAAEMFINSKGYDSERDGFIMYIDKTENSDIQLDFMGEPKYWGSISYFAEEMLYEIVVPQGILVAYFIGTETVSKELLNLIDIEDSLGKIDYFENYLVRFGKA